MIIAGTINANSLQAMLAMLANTGHRSDLSNGGLRNSPLGAT